MIPKLIRFLFGERIDRIPTAVLQEMGERGELTVREVERLIELQRKALEVGQ